MCTLFHFCLITTNTPIHFCLITNPPTPLDFLFSFVTLSLSSTCIPPTLLFLPHYTTTTPDFLSLNPFLYSHLPYIFPHYMYPPPPTRFFVFFRGGAHIIWNSPTVFARSFLDHKPKGQVTDKFLKPEKNYTSPNFFCQSTGGLEILIWLICRDVFYGDTHLCLWLKGSAYLPVFTFKERNSGLFCPIFLKFTFDNFTSPVGLAILKFYLPGPNFTSHGHRACAIFRRLAQYISDLLVLFLGGIAGFSWQEGKRSILYLSGIQQARHNLLVHVEMYCRLFLLMLQNSRPCLQLYRSHYSSGLWYSRENSGFSFPCSRGNSQFLSRLNIFFI